MSPSPGDRNYWERRRPARSPLERDRVEAASTKGEDAVYSVVVEHPRPIHALFIGWWIYMALEAFSGDERALGALALLLLVQPVLFDGLVAFVVAPPPSAAFPYQDLAHSLSLVAGVGALVALRRSMGWGRWGWQSWVVLALKVADSAHQFLGVCLPAPMIICHLRGCSA